MPTPDRRPTPTQTRHRALVNTRPHGIANKRTPQPGNAAQPTQRPRSNDNSRPNHLNQDPSKLESSTLTSRERTCCAEKSTKSLENSKELCPQARRAVCGGSLGTGSCGDSLCRKASKRLKTRRCSVPRLSPSRSFPMAHACRLLLSRRNGLADRQGGDGRSQFPGA